MAGFNIQSRTNKIFLPTDGALHPTRSIHLGRHRDSVSKNLGNDLDDLVEFGQRNNFTQKQFNDELRDIISAERQLLRSGERALNKNARAGAR